MKRSDIAMIGLIASISAVIAYLGAQAIFGNFIQDGAKIKTIDAISAQIESPSKTIFNSEAINPAVEVKINESSQTESSQ